MDVKIALAIILVSTCASVLSESDPKETEEESERYGYFRHPPPPPPPPPFVRGFRPPFFNGAGPLPPWFLGLGPRLPFPGFGPPPFVGGFGTPPFAGGFGQPPLPLTRNDGFNLAQAQFLQALRFFNALSERGAGGNNGTQPGP